MAQLTWGAVGKRLYENGVDKGVVYPKDSVGAYPKGAAWNGLTNITEKPSGAEPNPLYADNIKYLNLISAEEYAATVEAYTYPPEFEECDGSAELATGVTIGQQTRKGFGLCYRTKIGNDVDGDDHGYKLHLVYDAKAAPSEKGYASVNDNPDAASFSWEISTTPVSVTGHKPTASLNVDSTKVSAAVLAALEAVLYGSANADARLPLPDEVVTIVGGGSVDALALSSISPADAATAIAVGSNIVLTFNNKIAREAVVLTSAAGAVVTVAKSWDTDGKVLTLNPSADLSAATVYLVTIGGVVDVCNQSLAAVVKSFTTA